MDCDIALFLFIFSTIFPLKREKKKREIEKSKVMLSHIYPNFRQYSFISFIFFFFFFFSSSCQNLHIGDFVVSKFSYNLQFRRRVSNRRIEFAHHLRWGDVIDSYCFNGSIQVCTEC